MYTPDSPPPAGGVSHPEENEERQKRPKWPPSHPPAPEKQPKLALRENDFSEHKRTRRADGASRFLLLLSSYRVFRTALPLSTRMRFVPKTRCVCGGKGASTLMCVVHAFFGSVFGWPTIHTYTHHPCLPLLRPSSTKEASLS